MAQAWLSLSCSTRSATASVISAPAALMLAKVMQPETEHAKTLGHVEIEIEQKHVNLIEAAASGASDGMMLAINVAAMLIAFLALIALINGGLGLAGRAFIDTAGMMRLTTAFVGLLVAWVIMWRPSRTAWTRALGGVLLTVVAAWAIYAIRGPAELPMRLESILGAVLAPLAWTMGVPWSEAASVGELFGTKLVLTEIVGFIRMVEMSDAGLLSPKSELIASYALCGFANFASIAIQIGGIGGLAPSRKSDLARIGPWAMLAGTMASYSTATLAGMLSGL